MIDPQSRSLATQKSGMLTPHPLSVISDPFNQTKSTARVHQALQMGDGSSQPWVLL